VANSGDIYVGDGHGSSYFNQHDNSGKFVCPHGGYLDHKGNISVSGWVKVSRISKLRKV
jgi:hypothetical protein